MPPDGESMPPDGESVPPAECAAKLAEECVIELLERLERGEWLVRAFRGAAPRGASQSCTGAAPSAPNGAVDAASFLERYGETPLPPYIARPGGPGAADRERYQTVYASRPGAVAAPTAGLHFTSELLERLSAAGVRQAEVTLHVGLGTFSPIEAEDLRDHHMHAEWYDAPAGALAEADSARRAGGRIVAVGTTSARVLESLPVELGREPPPAASLSGWTDLFIYPPYGFRNVDALLTNFHLPGSTLLAMVMAFAGVDGVRAAYREAIEQGYRFYSYGDAMLVL